MTDNSDGLDSGIEVVPLPEFCRKLIIEAGGQFAKLWIFSREFHDLVCSDFVFLDLDVIVTSDLAFLHDANPGLTIMRGSNPAPPRRTIKNMVRAVRNIRSALDLALLFRRPPKKWCRYNSSIMVVRFGWGDWIWEGFDLRKALRLKRHSNIVGTDQAWLHFVATDGVRVVGPEQGVWNARSIDRYIEREGALPDLISFIAFPGGSEQKPWSPTALRLRPWLAKVNTAV